MKEKDSIISGIVHFLNINGFSTVEELDNDGVYEYLFSGCEYPVGETKVIINSNDMTVRFRGICYTGISQGESLAQKAKEIIRNSTGISYTVEDDKLIAECSFEIDGEMDDIENIVFWKLMEFRGTCFDSGSQLIGDLDAGFNNLNRLIEEELALQHSFKDFVGEICGSIEILSPVVELSYGEDSAFIKTENGVCIDITEEDISIYGLKYDLNNLTPDNMDTFLKLVRENPEFEFILNNSEIGFRRTGEIDLDDMLLSVLDVAFSYHIYLYMDVVLQGILSEI